MELSEIQRWMVIPALEQVPGVVERRQFRRLHQAVSARARSRRSFSAYGVGLNDVITAINNNSSNAGGSRISRGEQGYVIRGIGLVRTLDDLGNIVVTQRNGVPVLVRDLGKTDLQPPGARGHPRQGQQSRHHRGHRRHAQVARTPRRC